MSGPVLAGADGSAASMLAVAWAAEQAGRRGVPLTVACVTGTRSIGPLLAESIVDDACDLARAVAPGLSVRAVVGDGEPVAVLSELGSGCSLLVVGHRGAHGHPGPGPGSTSDALARCAPVEVVVVGMDADRFPLERCTGPALPPPSAVRHDRPSAPAGPGAADDSEGEP